MCRPWIGTLIQAAYAGNLLKASRSCYLFTSLQLFMPAFHPAGHPLIQDRLLPAVLSRHRWLRLRPIWQPRAWALRASSMFIILSAIFVRSSDAGIALKKLLLETDLTMPGSKISISRKAVSRHSQYRIQLKKIKSVEYCRILAINIVFSDFRFIIFLNLLI